MSDTTSTIETATADEVIKVLHECATDCANPPSEDDAINFSTLMDYHLADWLRYLPDDRLKIMDALHSIFAENKPLLTAVSWDLPALMLPFLDAKDWPQQQSLKQSRQVIAFYKVMTLVAEHGKAMELIVSCCEAIDLLDESSGIHQGVLLVQFHALTECVRCSVPRAVSAYAGRVLAVVVTSLIRMVMRNPISGSSLSVLRALYLFIRDYVPPMWEGEIDEALFEDEEGAQRALLRMMFDVIVAKLGEAHYAALIGEAGVQRTGFVILLQRLSALAWSLDINADAEMKALVESGLGSGVGMRRDATVILYGYSKLTESGKTEVCSLMELIEFQIALFSQWVQTPKATNIEKCTEVDESAKGTSPPINFTVFAYLLMLTAEMITGSPAAKSTPASDTIIMTYLQLIATMEQRVPSHNAVLRKLVRGSYTKVMRWMDPVAKDKWIWDTLWNCPYLTCLEGVLGSIERPKVIEESETTEKFEEDKPLETAEPVSTESTAESITDTIEKLHISQPSPPPLPQRPTPTQSIFSSSGQLEYVKLIEATVKQVRSEKGDTAEFYKKKLAMLLSFGKSRDLIKDSMRDLSNDSRRGSKESIKE